MDGDLPDFEEPTSEQVEWATNVKDRWTQLLRQVGGAEARVL